MFTDKQHRIVKAATEVFIRYGYKRVNMGDIAAAAEISRPALYLTFKNKEDIFRGAFENWVDETIAEIHLEMEACTSPHEKLLIAFELWTVRPFEAVLQSSDARELLECSFDFAKQSLEVGYNKFEALLVPIIEPLMKSRARETSITAQRTARVLAGATRGFKQMALGPEELRVLINDLLVLALDFSRPTATRQGNKP